MPPSNRKRKVGDDKESSTASSSSSKPRKKETQRTIQKARVYFRAGFISQNPGKEEDFDEAWNNWMATKGDQPADEFPGVPGYGSRQPASKKRKTSTTAASAKKTTPAKKTPTAAAAAPTPAAATASRSPDTSSRKQQKEPGYKERARMAMKKDSSAQPKKATPAKKAATPPRPAAAAPKRTASPAARSTQAYRTRRTPAKNEEVEEPAEDTLPKPPTRFPKTATPETQAPAAAADTGGPAFRPAPVVEDPPRPEGTVDDDRHDDEVDDEEEVHVKYEDENHHDDDVQVEYDDDDVQVEYEDDETMTWQERWETLQPLLRKLFLVLGVPLLALAVLIFGVGRYNPKSQMWMIVGHTRRHCSTHTVIFGSPCRATDPSNPYIVTDAIDLGSVLQQQQRCYHDSPQHVLALLDHDDAHQNNAPAKMTDQHCPNGFIQCPSNAICYNGHLLDCLAPAWVMYDNKNDNDNKKPPLCVLSQAVNNTYMDLVSLIETWSVQHLCMIRTEGPVPQSFYMQQQPSSSKEASVVVKADDMGNSDNGVPLYPWSTIYRMIDQDEWDWKLLQMANDAHKTQLVLEEDSLSVGLTAHRYNLVQRSKLPMPCKVRRGLFQIFEWVGRLGWSIGAGILFTIYSIFKAFPIMSIVTTLILGGISYWRHRRATLDRQRKLVNMVRHDVLRYLQTAWNKPPGVDLQQGEVAVIQVRDEIADRMYDGYYEDEKRQDFLLQVWPIVCLQISKDNRVRKVSRVIDGSRRALWIWTAPPAGENAMQS